MQSIMRRIEESLNSSSFRKLNVVREITYWHEKYSTFVEQVWINVVRPEHRNSGSIWNGYAIHGACTLNLVKDDALLCAFEDPLASWIQVELPVPLVFRVAKQDPEWLNPQTCCLWPPRGDTRHHKYYFLCVWWCEQCLEALFLDF